MTNSNETDNDNGGQFNNLGLSLGRFKQNTRESRTDLQQENLATLLMERLGVTDNNRLPYLAACYSGIPQATLERLAVDASEKGDYPPKMFMYYLKQQPLWAEYKKRKAERKHAS